LLSFFCRLFLNFLVLSHSDCLRQCSWLTLLSRSLFFSPQVTLTRFHSRLLFLRARPSTPPYFSPAGPSTGFFFPKIGSVCSPPDPIHNIFLDIHPVFCVPFFETHPWGFCAFLNFSPDGFSFNHPFFFPPLALDPNCTVLFHQLPSSKVRLACLRRNLAPSFGPPILFDPVQANFIIFLGLSFQQWAANRSVSHFCGSLVSLPASTAVGVHESLMLMAFWVAGGRQLFPRAPALHFLFFFSWVSCRPLILFFNPIFFQRKKTFFFTARLWNASFRTSLGVQIFMELFFGTIFGSFRA